MQTVFYSTQDEILAQSEDISNSKHCNKFHNHATME